MQSKLAGDRMQAEPLSGILIMSRSLVFLLLLSLCACTGEDNQTAPIAEDN
jgi:hypothetical protein